MTETESTVVPEKEPKENSGRKRVRHRKKLLYEKILRQMEFYFSDANLSKDRYLSQLTKDDPYVPLDIFLKFNKIRSLTNDVNDIAKAMKNSTLLEISEDRTKVKRKVPMLPYDADERTVYVESIPATANLDWLQKVFGEYGTVAYISMPKFKETKKIKGYAFVEYEKPEQAAKCLQALTEMGCKLPTTTPLDELASIKTFSLEHSEDGAQSNDKKEDEEPPKKKSKKKDKKNKNLELKITDEQSGNESKPETPVEEVKSIAPENASQTKGAGKTSGGAKKKRKKNERVADDRIALWGLQVLSKREWKSLRNRYLNLQREQVKAARRAQQNAQTESGSGPATGTDQPDGAPGRSKNKERQDNSSGKRQGWGKSGGRGRDMTLRFEEQEAPQFVSRKEDAELVEEAAAAAAAGLPTPSATHLRFDD